jgi:hypothetical protein
MILDSGWEEIERWRIMYMEVVIWIYDTTIYLDHVNFAREDINKHLLIKEWLVKAIDMIENVKLLKIRKKWKEHKILWIVQIEMLYLNEDYKYWIICAFILERTRASIKLRYFSMSFKFHLEALLKA